MSRGVVATLALVVAGCGASVTLDVTADGAGGDGATVDAGVDAATIDAAPCTGGQGQATSGGSCFEAFAMTPLAWSAAQQACAARGGGLVKIESLAENQVLLGLIGMSDYWIGGTDTANEMMWLWADGTPFVYTNWRQSPLEPNDGNGGFPEDCAVIEGARGGTWDDRPCVTGMVGPVGEYPYLCERPS